MKLDIVLITTGSRHKLLAQSLRSMKENADHWDQHSLTLVMDGCSVLNVCREAGVLPSRIILNPERQGASRSRNIGAVSTPKYRRKDAVCFFDDDIYCGSGWDQALDRVCRSWTGLVSGHAHPFNHTILEESSDWQVTTVLSTVQILIPWWIWDRIGLWTEPGGPGGSEDVDYCSRAAAQNMPFILTTPQCILHTGIGSTSGSKLVGWEQVMENNRRLEKVHHIQGKVVYE